MAALVMISSPYQIKGLTARESEIAVYAALGYTNRDIGEKAGIDPQTAKNHLRLIFLKLGIHKREQLEPIVWNAVPEVREQMLRVGRAPREATSISRPTGAGRGGNDAVSPEVRS